MSQRILVDREYLSVGQNVDGLLRHVPWVVPQNQRRFQNRPKRKVSALLGQRKRGVPTPVWGKVSDEHHVKVVEKARLRTCCGGGGKCAVKMGKC